MPRLDLAFFLCCCKSFLGHDPPEENLYNILNVDQDATSDELKRAYKQLSLKMHPDKLTQKGVEITDDHQLQFTKMKEAYEILSDQHKRESYDALGKKGMKYLEEPFSIDPQELAHNFATSSVIDRSKIFAIFVAIAICVLIQPILICLHIDGQFDNIDEDDGLDDGKHASWLVTLIPLWLWNGFLIFYHIRVILMGQINKPEHIPDEEWVDPLPMNKRYFSFFRFLLIVLFQILVALNLDGNIIHTKWWIVSIPLYAWECTTLYKKYPLAKMRIVTVEDLEAALGKPFSEFTNSEKELIGKRYSVVSSLSSPDFDAATKLKIKAKTDVLKSIFRIVLVAIILIKLDFTPIQQWNWYIIFIPLWIVFILVCCMNYKNFIDIQKMAMEKDPTIFSKYYQQQGVGSGVDEETGVGSGVGQPQQQQQNPMDYGAVGDTTNDGNNNNATTSSSSPLTEQERNELRQEVQASGSRFCNRCCSQVCLLLLAILFVGKLQGADFSSFWIISPFLLFTSLLLCLIGCAIFGVTEVKDGVEFDTGNSNAAAAAAAAADVHYVPPPPEPEPVQHGATSPTTAATQTTETSNPSSRQGESLATTKASNVNKNNNNNNKPVDLLDDVEQQAQQQVVSTAAAADAATTSSQTNQTDADSPSDEVVGGEIHELD